MPVLLPVAAWAAAVASAVTATTLGVTALSTAWWAVYAVSYAAITAVASGIVSYGVQLLIGGGQKPTQNRGQTIASSGSAEGFRHVVGKARVYGVKVWPTAFPVTFKHRSDDALNHGYGQFQILSATPLTSIDGIYWDDVLLSLVDEARTGGSPIFFAGANSPLPNGITVGNSHLYVQYGLGDTTEPGERDPLLGWYSDQVWQSAQFFPSTATADGVAWLSSVAVWDDSPVCFPAGPPRMSAVVTGIAVYDPRDSGQDPDDDTTWAWSDNPALIAAWFVTRPFGFSATYDDIDLDTLIVAANDCDEEVDTFESTIIDFVSGMDETEKKYRCWGEILEGDDRDGTLAAICATMAGGWAEGGGKWYFFAGAYHAPAETVDDEWVFGEITYVAQGEIDQAINTLSGTFLSATNRWQQIPYPEVQNADALAEVDGNVVEDTLDLVLVPSHTQAQRIALIEVKRRMGGRALTMNTHLGYALRVRPGEITNLNLPDYAIVDQPFRVEKWNLTVASSGGESDGQLMVELSLREETEAGYTVTLDEMTDLPASPAFEADDWGGGVDTNPYP